MLAERGIDVTYETIRRWTLKFGTIIARKLRRGRPRPDGRWHLDEVFVSINGRQFYIWRAVDGEGEVLDILVQPRRDRQAALKLMRKLLKKQGITPATSYAGFWVTRRSGGVVCRRFDDLDAVLESDTSDDLRQLICAFQPPPGL